MKLFLIAIAIVTMFSFEEAKAYPSSTNVSLPITTSTGSGRRFNTTRTAASVGCSFYTGANCPLFYTLYGWNPAGNACCFNNHQRQDPAPEVINESDESLESAFQPRVESYWGYIGTTSRSPNAGRGNSALARLDACVNYTKADTYTVGSQIAWNTCNSDCDTAQNGYCNNTGTNNGVSNVASAACKDRCDCVIDTAQNWGVCEGM